MKQTLAAVLLWIGKRLGRYRAAVLFHEARKKDRAFVDELVQYVLNCELPDRVLSEHFLAKYCGDGADAFWARVNLLVPADVDAMLDQIPSETTRRERRLLWLIFSSLWSGVGDVVEIGPFLGGTTRAIALGMLANPRYEGGRLWTFDRFEDYHDPEVLKGIVAPLVRNGLLSEVELAEIGSRAFFLSIFKRLHAGSDYGKAVFPVSMALPETPEEAAAGKGWFRLEPGTCCSAFFSDGCKSWYSTKYFMAECLRTAPLGSYFIFQDFVWYTCFWLPCFLELFADFFRLVCHADHTYAFQLVAPLAPDLIDARYPDRAEDLSANEFAEIFTRLRAKAETRRDPLALFFHPLQYGAALAYVGESEKARAHFASLSADPVFSGCEAFVAEVAKAPTYRPTRRGGEGGPLYDVVRL